MKEPTRVKKEKFIIEAAEEIFSKVGFKNARMEDVAAEAKITKVTLYSYFQSKENLYMAVTYRGLNALAESYRKCAQTYAGLSGLDVSINLMDDFIDFCEKNYLYSEALLDYFSLVRSTNFVKDDTKLTDAMKESSYFAKVQELQNLPYKIVAKEIQRGIDDGSINPKVDPMFQTIQSWIMIVGYVKVLAAAGNAEAPLFGISLKESKQYILDLKRTILQNPIHNK